MHKNRMPLILSGVWFFVFYLVMEFPMFGYVMGTATSSSPFMDLQFVLSAGDCSKLPLQDVMNGVCDPWNRHWCYAVWIIHLVQFLHLSNHYYLLIGWINALLIALCIGVLTRYFTKNLIWAYLAAFSPPMFFLAERGNTDTLIMALTIIFVFAVIKEKAHWFFWIPGLLMGTKIYPGGIFLAFSKLKDFIWGIIAAALFAIVWIRDIGTILGNQPHCRGWQFGDIAFYTQDMTKCYDNGVISTKVTVLLATATISMWFAAFVIFNVLKPGVISGYVEMINKNTSSQALIKASGAIFVISFLGVSMVDYKLWSVVLLAFGITNLDFGSNKIFRAVLLFLVYFGLWGNRVTPLWIQYFANWALVALTFLVFAYLVQDLIEKGKASYTKVKRSS
jgi:hypothetical protein